MTGLNFDQAQSFRFLGSSSDEWLRGCLISPSTRKSIAGAGPDRAIDIVNLLPAFARSHRYRYPKTSTRDFDRPVLANCLWTALNCFRAEPDDRFLDVQFAVAAASCRSSRSRPTTGAYLHAGLDEPRAGRADSRARRRSYWSRRRPAASSGPSRARRPTRASTTACSCRGSSRTTRTSRCIRCSRVRRSRRSSRRWDAPRTRSSRGSGRAARSWASASSCAGTGRSVFIRSSRPTHRRSARAARSGTIASRASPTSSSRPSSGSTRSTRWSTCGTATRS